MVELNAFADECFKLELSEPSVDPVNSRQDQFLDEILSEGMVKGKECNCVGKESLEDNRQEFLAEGGSCSRAEEDIPVHTRNFRA